MLSKQLSLVDTMATMSLRADALRNLLGYAWWILEPALLTAVFYFVFEVLFQRGGEGFLPFLVVGKFIFVWFSKTVTQASNAIVGSAGLISRTPLPLLIPILAVVQEGLYRQLLALVVVVVFLGFLGYLPAASWWVLAPLLLVSYLLIVACSIYAAMLVALARDFTQIISLSMMALMFLSGIFWDVRSLSPENQNLVLTLNPLAFLVDAYRAPLLYDAMPDIGHLLTLGAVSCVFIWLGQKLLQSSRHWLYLRAITA